MAIERPKKPKTDPQLKTADLYLPPYFNRFLLTLVFVVIAFVLASILNTVVLGGGDGEDPVPQSGALVILLLCMTLVFIAMLFRVQGFMERSHERYEKSRADALQKAQLHIDRLYAIMKVTHVMGTAADRQSVFDHMTESCAEVFTCHQVSLMLFDKESEELVVRSVNGPAARKEALDKRQKLGQGIAGWAAERREPLVLSSDVDLSQYPGLELKSNWIAAAMVVPITIENSLVGVLNVSSRSKNVDYDEEDMRALQVFAENVGVRLRHSQKVHSMKRVIQRLTDTVREKEASPASGTETP